LLFVRLAPLFVFDKLLEGQAVHFLDHVALGVIYFDVVYQGGGRIDHLVSAACEIALSEDDLVLKLLAMVTKTQVLALVAVFYLH